MAWTDTPVKICSFIAGLADVTFATSLGEFEYAIVLKDATQPLDKDGDALGSLNLVQATDSEYDLWIYETVVSNEYSFIGDGSTVGTVTEIYEDAFSSDISQLYAEDNILLSELSITTLDKLGNAQIASNNITAVSIDTFVDKLYSNAVTLPLASGVLDYRFNPGTDSISAIAQAQASALEMVAEWSVNSSSEGGNDVDWYNAYDVQATVANLDAACTARDNIDMSVIANFISIGTTATPFTGTCDGQGFELTGLTINRPTENDIGLFGRISGATIHMLCACNVNIIGQTNVGLIGTSVGTSSEVSLCSVTGTIEGSVNAGGIVGRLFQGNAENCYSLADVTAGAVYGGIVGAIGNASATVTNCHSYFEGLDGIGDNTAGGTVTACYDLNGTVVIAGLTHYSAAQFIDEDNFIGWDFNTLWYMSFSQGHPIFQYETDTKKSISGCPASVFERDNHKKVWAGCISMYE